MNINQTVTPGSEKCSGCTACQSVCPRQCISMTADGEGFLYPQVDTRRCVDCGLCVKVCPFHNPAPAARPAETLAARNNDEATRRASSSGGIFTLMAERVIAGGGVVFGAAFTRDWQVEIVPADTMDALARFRGSKYVQARMGDSLRTAKKLLREGRKVMFCGTPCQIAGLRHYLGKDYDNLLAIDFVCHGVPSPKVWARYLAETTGGGGTKAKDVKFRDKRGGWKRYRVTIAYADGAATRTTSSFYGDNPYMRAFLGDLILRPSCYNCQAKCGRSGSDITIADYWGVEQVHPQMDDDLGTSLLLVHTAKGEAALGTDGMTAIPSAYADAVRFNPAIEKSATAHPHRADFFARLDSSGSVARLIGKELRPTPAQWVQAQCHRAIYLTKRAILRLLSMKPRKTEGNSNEKI